MTPTPPITTYATADRLAAYVTAMRGLADRRAPGAPVRVYLCAQPHMTATPGWEKLVRRISRALPRGVRAHPYGRVFGDDGRDYDTEWDTYAANLDGLVVAHPLMRDSSGGRIRMYPRARAELRSVVGRGRPVLVWHPNLGLVPLVDCAATVQPTASTPLRLRIPAGYAPGSPTRRAALAALTPKGAA
ncbi:hypothetical protein AB0G95_21705 [Streptomyces virginiae]|uniref:hypothetical protein n=1 Tax=Streptomyces virginiae TaxID=1961 RepID=UPI00341C5EFF